MMYQLDIALEMLWSYLKCDMIGVRIVPDCRNLPLKVYVESIWQERRVDDYEVSQITVPVGFYDWDYQDGSWTFNPLI